MANNDTVSGVFSVAKQVVNTVAESILASAAGQHNYTAAEQAAKSNPAIPLQSSTPLPKSNPAMDTVRQQPRASLDTSERAVETPNRSESYGASSPESAAETDRSNYGSPSMSGGFSSTSSMSSYGYGASKPAAAPYKPSARKSAAASSTWLSDTLESLKEPKAIGSICAIAFVLLMVGWQFLPKNRADDIKKYQALKQLLDEVKSKRTSAPAELTALQQKLTKIGKEIATELKDKASRDEPAKQCLLWAARDEIPRLVQAGLGAESPAEQTLTNRLKDAAYELGLEKRPPVDLTQLAARNDD